MLTITLSWATLLWALASAGALFVGYSLFAAFHIAVEFWHNREYSHTDWEFASNLFRPAYQPLGWLVIKVLRLPLGRFYGRVLHLLGRSPGRRRAGSR